MVTIGYLLAINTLVPNPWPSNHESCHKLWAKEYMDPVLNC